MNGLNAAYLIWGTVASVIGVGTAVYALVSKLKKGWIDEVKRTEAIAENTKAVKELGDKLDGYAQRTDARLNGHDGRINKLENFMNRGTK